MAVALKLGFIGGGEMGGALAHAMRKFRPLVSTSRNNRNLEIVRKCDIVFLCVRPRDIAAVAAQVKGELKEGQTLVSIAAGQSVAKLRRLFGRKARIVRVMPNLGVKAGLGMCAVAKTAAPSAGRVCELLSLCGKVAVIPEKDFDAFTAVAGSGPAYFAYMLAAMGRGGAKLGLKPADSARFALQTMLGTAKYLEASQASVDKFIDQVATPGGTTAAGKTALDDSGRFAEIVEECLARCAARSKELGR